MNEFISTFHIDWKIMIAQVINFGLVLSVIYFLAVKPIRKVLATRNKEITEGLENAEKNRDILEKTQQDYQDMLTKARNESHDIWEEAKKDAEKVKASIIESAQKEAEEIIKKSKRTAEMEKEQILAEAKKELISLVTLSIEKITGSEVENVLSSKIIKELKDLK